MAEKLDNQIIYKSTSNIEVDKKLNHQIEYGKSASFVLDANTSCIYTITFVNAFSTPPHILYSLSCNDNEFNIESHITDVTFAVFKIAINNSFNGPRTIIINYKATSTH